MKDEYGGHDEPDCPEDFFKIQFPSLKKDTIVPFRNGKQFVDIGAIQEHCLDKSKVNEAINEQINDARKVKSGEVVIWMIGLLKELGLMKDDK